VNNKVFESHGRLHLSVDGQFLFINGTGPANVELVQEYQDKIMAFRQKIMHSPWVSLVCFSGLALVSPEAKTMFIKAIKHAKSMNLLATAAVFVDNEYIDTSQRFWSEIYQEAGISYDFFDSQQNAREWLQQKLNGV
jgi:hypothetical protein